MSPSGPRRPPSPLRPFRVSGLTLLGLDRTYAAFLAASLLAQALLWAGLPPREPPTLFTPTPRAPHLLDIRLPPTPTETPCVTGDAWGDGAGDLQLLGSPASTGCAVLDLLAGGALARDLDPVFARITHVVVPRRPRCAPLLRAGPDPVGERLARIKRPFAYAMTRRPGGPLICRELWKPEEVPPRRAQSR